MNSLSRFTPQTVRGFAGVMIALLAASTLMQAMILWRLSGPTAPATIKKVQDVRVVGEVAIETPYGGLPVDVETLSAVGAMPVSISETVSVDVRNSEVPVNVRNHYIIGNDPIPVEIVR